ncbi:MAG: tetratricopeptide repeat protein [Deltaproteobacteria bacterium]|nr:tetratricopeptide repeat protein [Deltaproteobacteria bacterium]
MDHYRQYQQAMQLKKPEMALKYLQQHLKANPRHAEGFFHAGTLLRDLNRWPEALNAFHEACQLEPNKVEHQLNRGIILNQMQMPLEAINAFNIAYSLKQDPGILYNRSLALLLAGRYPGRHWWSSTSRD